MDKQAPSFSPFRVTEGTTAADAPRTTLTLLADLYRFCGQSMRFPEPAWFNANFLTCLYTLLEQLGGNEEMAALQTAIRFSSLGVTLQEIQIEHTRLFITGIPHVAAPPYGSVYLDGSLHGKSTDNVLQFYFDHGYRLQHANIPPDHLVCQLEFLAHLAERGDIAAERAFLATCLIPWYRFFMERVLREARHPFYRTVVQIIAYFIQEEDENGIHGFTA